MEILAVSLKNFKSHSDRHFEFQPGVNAICGENGAGKTSIFEAIAWALFDHSSSYQKADLIRTGSPSAQVTVQIQSHLDGRSYDVIRCTNRGYDLYDPQLKSTLGIRRVDDITLWLRQHLGVPTGTELSKLFADTIGIPQGTFTSDFLRSPDARKRVFDPILKVEDYKQAFTRSFPLEKHAEEQVQALEQMSRQYELQLADWASLQAEFSQRRREVEQDQTQLQVLTDQLTTLEAQLTQLQQQAEQLEGLRQQLSQRLAEINAQQSSISFLAAAVAQAEQARELCEVHAPGYQAYQTATAQLQILEQQWQRFDQLRQERERQQQMLAQGQTRLIQLQTRLAALEQAHQEIARLQPLVARQQELEQQLQDWQQQWQQLQAAKQQREFAQQRLAQQQRKQAQLVVEIQNLEHLAPQIAAIPSLEQQQQRYQQQLLHLQAAQQFAAQLTQLVDRGETQQQAHATQVQTTLKALRQEKIHPSLLQPTEQTLAVGQQIIGDLLQGLSQIRTDLSLQTDPQQLRQNLAAVEAELRSANLARTEFATLHDKQTQQADLAAEIANLQAHVAQVQTHLDQEASLQAQYQEFQTQLAALEDPRGQRRLFQQQLQEQSQLQEQYEQHHRQQSQIEQQIHALETEMAGFVNLQNELDTQKQHQTRFQADYQTYLEQIREAERLPQLTVQYQQTVAKLATLKHEREALETEVRQREAEHSPGAYEALRSQCTDLRSHRDQLCGGLPPKQAQLAEIEQKLEKCQHLAQERDQLLVELTRRRELQQFVMAMRNVFNQSGPRISRFYLSSISQEADRLFRELLNRPDVALAWSEDYEIRVQDSGHWRSFKSLSGGEQMCAALAVRLALLKILVDIDIAFFDEPTTNMDQVRRRQLAAALGNLKSFRQLFVISHDDTFESMTENIIRVERQT